VWYDNHPPEAIVVAEPDPFDEMIMQMGIRHEWGIKRDLEKQFQVIEAISVGTLPPFSLLIISHILSKCLIKARVSAYLSYHELSYPLKASHANMRCFWG
jgi:hypothetical protein